MLFSLFDVLIVVVLQEFVHYDPCAILLGLGAFFVWMASLRFLGYFRSYNVSTSHHFLVLPSERLA